MAELLKDRYFTPEKVKAMADAFEKNIEGFHTRQFLKAVLTDDFSKKELKEKMRHITLVLHKTLDRPYNRAVRGLMKAAPAIDDLEGWVLPDYVELFGLEKRFRSLSFEALKCFTRYSTSEFAIRPFLLEDLDEALDFLHQCAEDEHENVRRFASEGARPRLPWGKGVPALKENPKKVIAILEKLKADESEFVRKSVANNLNDISKDHETLALQTARKWLGKSEHTDWIVKHAMRGLLKKGNGAAMAMFGFGDISKVQFANFSAKPKKLSIGKATSLSFTFSLKSATNLRFEYAIDFILKSGKKGRKVFKVSEKEFAAGEHKLERNHSFADVSTRKHYPGNHTVTLLANGEKVAAVEVVLEG